MRQRNSSERPKELKINGDFGYKEMKKLEVVVYLLSTIHYMIDGCVGANIRDLKRVWFNLDAEAGFNLI